MEMIRNLNLPHNLIKVLVLAAIYSLGLISFSQAQDWAEIQKVVASDREGDEIFGRQVNISDNYAIVGAPLDSEDINAGNTLYFAGSAYIYKRDQTGVWNLVQKIVASDRAEDDYFGHAVDISGNYAIVGAYSEDEDSGGGNYSLNAGSAYIFERNIDGVWIEVQKIVASDRYEEDAFGISVSVSAQYAVVGAYYEDEDINSGNTIDDSGSAYVFERDGNGNWIQIQKITALDRSKGAKFGNSVSIFNEYLIIGSSGDQYDADGLNQMLRAGSAYIFELDVSGDWLEVEKLVANQRKEYDHFGYAVSISGNYAIVGAIFEDEDALENNPLDASGSAYIFNRSIDGAWGQGKKIVASDREVTGRFGHSVAIDSDYAIVSASGETKDTNGGNPLPSAGAAYLYKMNSSGQWLESQKLVSSDRQEYDVFGVSVSISNDVIMVGASLEDEDENGQNTFLNAGSVYIFENPNINKYYIPDPVFASFLYDEFGESLITADGWLDINEAKNVDSLRIVDSEQILSIDGIGFFTNLWYLMVLDVSIQEIPKEISSIKTLEKLGFSGDGITELPRMALPNLKILVISTLSLESAEANAFDDLPLLEFLDLDGSDKMQTLPQLSHLSNLKTLQLEIGGLRSLPELPPALEELIIYHNSYLTTFPDFPPTLKELFCHVCISVNTLPEIQHTALTDVTLLANSLETLPMPPATLENIDVRSNKLTFETMFPYVHLGTSGLTNQRKFGIADTVTIYSGEDYTITQFNIDDTVTASQYEWYRDDVLVATSNQNTLLLSAVTPQDAGKYSVKVTNPDVPGVTLYSDSLTINIDPTLASGDWSEIEKVVGTDRAAGEWFGWDISISGNYAIIGSPQDDEDANGANPLEKAGSAYIYQRDTAGNWNLAQKITASDRATEDTFGFAVDISGSYAIVGARYEDEDANGANTLLSAGSAYIFERDTSGVWHEVKKIVAQVRQDNDLFGGNVSIDGNYAVVGAINADEDASSNSIFDNGVVYVFERMAGDWVQSQSLIGSFGTSVFGSKVSLNGSDLIVGAWNDRSDENGENPLWGGGAGAAYIFQRANNGTWGQVQKLVASDRKANHLFGQDVDIDGDYAVVTAAWDDKDENGIDSVFQTGSAYVFKRNESGTWSEVQKVVAPIREVQDYFGASVSISGDRFIVGSQSEDEDGSEGNTVPDAGSAYIFQRDNAGVWNLEQKVVHSDRAANDTFGHSVSMSGENILIGAYEEDEDENGQNTFLGAGSVYIFEVLVVPCEPHNTSEEATICSGDNYTFPDGTTQTNITEQKVYTSNLQAINGCDSTIVTTVNVNPIYDLTEEASICSGEDYTFPDGNTQTNITDQVVYTSNLQSINSCDSLIVTTVNVNPLNSFGYAKSNYCTGEDNPIPIVTGAEDAFFSSQSGLVIDPTSGEINLEDSQSGTYIVSIQSGLCIENSEFEITIETVDLLESFIVEVKDENCAHKGHVEIDRNGIDGGTVPYKIEIVNSNNGENVVLSDDKSKFTNLAQGIYYLNVTDAVGCKTTWIEDIEISQDEEDCKARVITPNADGRYDSFSIPFEDNRLVKIYNRGGQLVKEFTTPAEWDATDKNGNPVAMGVYVLISGSESVQVTVVR